MRKRHLVARHPDLHRPPGRGDHVDHRPDRGRRPRGVERHRRTAAPGPVPGRARRPRRGRSTRACRRPCPGQRQAAVLEVDDQHLGAALARHQADALADRTGAQHDHALARGRSRPGARRCTAIDTGSAIAATRRVVGGGYTCSAGSDQQLLEAAVEMDADQPEVVARVRAADAARVALPARAQRPHRHPRPTASSSRQPGPIAAIVAPTSWPCTRGNCEPPASADSSPGKKW